jgi:hypothetical protein
MAGQFIPAGRTSIVNKGGVDYQLQTEYARHPHPRITTSIFTQGQVLHKIERPLETDIDSLEEMHAVEDIIKKQHQEVATIIREKGLSRHAEQSLKRSEEKIRSSRIASLPEVEKVYLVTSEGKLTGDKQVTKQFGNLFRHVLKGLPELLKVFTELPGAGHTKEEGLYEIEPNRLLLASTGAEFFLILLKPGTDYSKLSPQIQKIISGK